jgi:hypothetical protein
MCSAERTLLRQRHHGMSFSGMTPMVDERGPRREEFSESCTVTDRTFPSRTRSVPVSTRGLVNANVTFQVVRDGRLVAARQQSASVRKTLEGAP